MGIGLGVAEAVVALTAGPDPAVAAAVVMANVAVGKPAPEALLLLVSVAAIVAVVLAGVTAVVVFRVGAVVPDVLGKAGVLGVLAALSTCEPVLPPILLPILPPVLPMLPPGMGTLGSSGVAETGGQGVGGRWSGFHRDISQS